MPTAVKYVSQTKPKKHQTEAQRRLKKRPRSPSPEDVMAWLMDKGTGKSKVVLDEWQDGLNSRKYDLLVVIAPSGSWKNWFRDKTDAQPSEINRHLDKKLLKVLRWASWKGKAEMKHKRAALLTHRDNPRAFFVNIESFSGPSGKVEKYLRELLKTSRGALGVIDESTTIRARRAERTQSVMRLRSLFKGRRILSGLVTPKSPMDLFYQFYFLDWRILGYESIVEFRNRYAVVETQCFLPSNVLRYKLEARYKRAQQNVQRVTSRAVMVKELSKLAIEDEDTQLPDSILKKKLLSYYDPRNVETHGRETLVAELNRLGVYFQQAPIIKGFRNLDELQQKIAPYSYRVLKEDCLDLDPKIYMTRDVELTDEQTKAYHELREYATTEINGQHVVALSPIARFLRLHQIACGHARDENRRLAKVKSNRVTELLEVLEDHSGKAVIWSTFRPEIDEIVARIRKEYDDPRIVAQFHGGNTKTRDDEEKRFLSDPRCRFMVSTQATGGRGNTWVVADLVIYASNNFDLEQRDQSEDRTHRIGQTRPCTYVDLVARGTVDEKVIQALRAKIDIATAITGENYREWII